MSDTKISEACESCGRCRVGDFANCKNARKLAEASKDALPFVAYAYSQGIEGAEEAGRAIETALNAAPLHPQSAELAEQQGCSTFDVTDPWRGLYLPARMPAPSEYGDLTHPDIPLWPDDREDALDKLVHAQGFDFHIVAGDFTEAAMEDGDELYWEELRAWNPEAPEGEWRLAWKGDTEDGPYAWFVRPMALRPEPAALAATGKQQVGDDGMPMVCVTQEFKDQADYDAEISSAASNLLRNNTLGLSGSLPEMVEALLNLASGQQVGEAQGDALPPMPKCHDRQPDDMPGYMESALDWTRDPDNCEAVEWLMENHAAIRAALAARQPGAQVPLCFITARDADQLRSHDVTLRHVATYWDRPGDDAVPVYLAPPAQGIDLAPFRPFVQAERTHLSGRIERCDAIGSADRLKALQAKARECDRLLALIDGQPGAAPTLWCLHVLGMDDVYPAPSKEHADKAAAEHNARFKEQAARIGITVEAVVAPWPHSAESHAASVAEFIPSWLIPQWQATALENDGAVVLQLLANMRAHRVAALNLYANQLQSALGLRDQDLPSPAKLVSADAESVRDTTRLDWLEKNGCAQFNGPSNDERGPGYTWFDTETAGCDYSPTLRDAIDAVLAVEYGVPRG